MVRGVNLTGLLGASVLAETLAETFSIPLKMAGRGGAREVEVEAEEAEAGATIGKFEEKSGAEAPVFVEVLNEAG